MEQSLINAVEQRNVQRVLRATRQEVNALNVTTALAAAAMNQTNYPSIVRILLNKGANVNKRGMLGLTPLIWACDFGNYKIAKALIEHGANLELRDYLGQTALHAAVRRNRLNIVKLLLDHGANITAKTNDGQTPLIMAARRPERSEVLHELLKRGAGLNANSVNRIIGFIGKNPSGPNAAYYKQLKINLSRLHSKIGHREITGTFPRVSSSARTAARQLSA